MPSHLDRGSLGSPCRAGLVNITELKALWKHGYMNNGPSLRSLHLTMRWDEQVMGVGTGFIGELDGCHYLVSVKHNFTGRDPLTGKFLGKHQISPNNIVLRATASDPQVGWRNVSIRLIGDDWEPLWFEDPSDATFDIAAIEVHLDEDVRIEPYLLDQPSVDLHPLLAVTDELYVVGFPRGLAYNVNMPIWSRATVASEPGAGFNGRPIFLVDVRTTKGHSGSPVILKPRNHQVVPMVDGSQYAPAQADVWLAGIYSGRIKSQGRKIDIGVVWRLGAIVNVVRSRATRDEKGKCRWLPLEGEFP